MEESSDSTPQINSTKKIPICTKCISIPIISIDQDDTVNITCNCENRLLKDFLDQLISISDKCDDHPEAQAVSYCIECKKFLCTGCIDYHKKFIDPEHHLLSNSDIIIPKCSVHDKDKEYYCEDCKEYLCLNCLEKHEQDHKFIDILKIISEINIEYLKRRIKEGERYLTEYYPTVKNEYIKQIKEEYENSFNMNKNILELYKIMADNYIPNTIINYTLLRNISNFYLQFDKWDEEEKYIEFLRENRIMYSYYQNFNLNSLHCVKTITDHTDCVYSLCILKDGRLVSCSADNTIKIFNPKKNYNCDLTITGHSGPIISVCVLNDGKLASCSRDKKIMIFKIDNDSYQLCRTLEGHTNSVAKVICIPYERIASCSWDETIKIWDCSTYECIKTLTGHSNYVESLLIMNNSTLVSGSWDRTLRVWDIFLFNSEKTIEDVYCRSVNSLIKIDFNRVAVGGQKVVNIVNISSSEIEQEIIVEGYIFALLLLRDGTILMGNSEKTLYHYKLQEKILNKKKENFNTFCFLDLNQDVIVSCSLDKAITIWNVDERFIKKRK